MNILALFFHDHPDALERIVGRERVGFGDIPELVSDYEFPFDVQPETLEELSTYEPQGELLSEAYLPVIEQDYWRSRVDFALPPRPNLELTAEWVTFVASPHLPVGISLPEDSDRRILRLSMFARGEVPRRISAEYASGPGMPTAVGVSEVGGCSLPDWGECHGDECAGDCQLRRVHDDDDGLECYCPPSL